MHHLPFDYLRSHCQSHQCRFLQYHLQRFRLCPDYRVGYLIGTLRLLAQALGTRRPHLERQPLAKGIAGAFVTQPQLITRFRSYQTGSNRAHHSASWTPATHGSSLDHLHRVPRETPRLAMKVAPRSWVSEARKAGQSGTTGLLCRMPNHAAMGGTK